MLCVRAWKNWIGKIGLKINSFITQKPNFRSNDKTLMLHELFQHVFFFFSSYFFLIEIFLLLLWLKRIRLWHLRVNSKETFWVMIVTSLYCLLSNAISRESFLLPKIHKSEFNLSNLILGRKSRHVTGCNLWMAFKYLAERVSWFYQDFSLAM